MNFKTGILILSSIALFIPSPAPSQSAGFTGHSGLYFLGSADIPVNISHYNDSRINGVVVRFRWEKVEPSPGNFNFEFIDSELAKAKSANKKISLQPLGVPVWMALQGVRTYNYINNNPNQPSYGEIQQNVITWDTNYVSKFKNFLKQLSLKYSGEPAVAYINSIGGAFSRNLPDSVVIDTATRQQRPFWEIYSYDADSLANLMNWMTDYYMSLFPSTSLWCSVDYVRFEQKASGRPINYLAALYTSYGINNYPDRFGLFREDISGCNPNINNISGTSHWYIMKQNECRTGAQMLWNVQDGPVRMNQCGMIPNTKQNVFDAAIENGISLGMRYIEVYGADIIDSTLSQNILQANIRLIDRGDKCGTSVDVSELKENNFSETGLKLFQNYPNPFNPGTTIKFSIPYAAYVTVKIFNLLGEEVRSLISQNMNAGIHSIEWDASGNAGGVYLCKIAAGDFFETKKLLLLK